MIKQTVEVSIITIGDEILVGQTVDTNSAWIAMELNKVGISVQEIISISDQKISIIEALDREIKKSSIVIITGGLGPTLDDITKKTLTDYFGDELILYPEILQRIENYFSALKRPMLEVNRQQAMLPAKAKIIENDLGTASGMWFTKDEKTVISLPGVPFEMKGLMNKIIPELKKQFSVGDFFHQTVSLQGLGETYISDKIKDLESICIQEDISLAYLPSPGLVRMRFTGTNEKKSDILKLIEEIEKRFPEQAYGRNEETLEIVIGKILKTHQKTISTVESCTGGALSARITSIPGSSEYYEGSIISYSNSIKESVVKIPWEIIKNHGAVSKQCVEAMASEGRKLLKTDYCIATSGIAGPDGGTPEKPVGTVWIAVSSEKETISHKFEFKHNRERNIELTVVYALNFLRRTLVNDGFTK